MKVNTIEDIGKRLHLIDDKLAQQGERLDHVQTKVDLFMTSLGQVQQEQTMVARALKATAAASPESSPPTPPQCPPPLLPTPTSTSGASTSVTPPPHGDPPREQVSRIPVTTSAPEVGEPAPVTYPNYRIKEFQSKLVKKKVLQFCESKISIFLNLGEVDLTLA